MNQRIANSASRLRLTFDEIAKLIAPENTPLWLSGHLEWTAAAAIAVLSKFGAEAFKSAATRKERLRQNDFALLYFLHRWGGF